jgi:hypothetical protein
LSNSWLIFTDAEMSFDDIRQATEQALHELLRGTQEGATPRVQIVHIDGAYPTEARLRAIVTGPRAPEDSDALLRLPTGDQVFAGGSPGIVSFGLGSKTPLAEVLGIAGAIGVARRVGGMANYGDSILPEVQATREFDGHDPNELLAHLKLEQPAVDLRDAVRAVLAKTIWAGWG